MINIHEVSVVYSGGVLKPFKKLNLVEGQKVEIEIKERKGRKNISLRGLWKGSKISEKEKTDAKQRIAPLCDGFS